MTIRDGIEAICPPFLADGVAKKLLWSIGLALDGTREVLRHGVLARFPGVGTPDALPSIAKDRLFERGIDETNATFGERLGGAFDEHQTRGTAQALLRALRAHFLATNVPLIRVVSDRGTWHEIDMSTGVITRTKTSPSNWVWDTFAYPDVTPRWWRGWVIIDMSAGPWIPSLSYGEPGYEYNDDARVDYLSIATLHDVATLRRLVKTWKPQNVHVVNIITTFDAALFLPSNTPGVAMPDGDWDVEGNREPDAAYLEGVI